MIKLHSCFFEVHYQDFAACEFLKPSPKLNFYEVRKVGPRTYGHISFINGQKNEIVVYAGQNIKDNQPKVTKNDVVYGRDEPEAEF